MGSNSSQQAVRLLVWPRADWTLAEAAGDERRCDECDRRSRLEQNGRVWTCRGAGPLVFGRDRSEAEPAQRACLYANAIRNIVDATVSVA